MGRGVGGGLIMCTKYLISCALLFVKAESEN